MSDLKARNWVAVLFEDSLKDNWLDELEELCIPAFVSPLHAADEKDKKPHYHVIFMYDNTTAYHLVLQDFQRLANVSICKACRSLVGSARYLVHLDQPKKEQFNLNPCPVLSFSGADWNYIKDLPKDSLVSLCDIFSIIDTLGIHSWRAFVWYCKEFNKQLLDTLRSSTSTVICVKEYLKDESAEVKVLQDKFKTGECSLND